MNLENSIKDVITLKLEDGSIEKLIGEQLEKGIVKAMDNLLGSYGDVTKVIEKELKSVMIPYLESYDYSQYILKLDSILVEVLKNSSLENKKMLSNFKNLLTKEDEIKEIKVTDLFGKWMDYVAKNVETSGLDINYDDGVSYSPVEVTFDLDQETDRGWSSFEYANLVFECEHDEKMNFVLRLHRWKEDKKNVWNMSFDSNKSIKSLKYLNEFEILLMKFDQAGTKIELDERYGSEDVQPEKEPEASFE